MLREVIIDFFKRTSKEIIKHSPEILTGVAIVGSLSSVIMAVKATPEAVDLIEEEKEILLKEAKEQCKNKAEEKDIEIVLTWKDYVRICWRLYWPTAATLTTSMLACILSNYIRAKRAGALATAFAITQESLRTYQDKVIEEVGRKKEQKIRDEIAKDKLKANPRVESSVILTGKGKYLFYDTFSGRYFRSTIQDVKRAQNELNDMINKDMYASVNDFYDLLNIPELRNVHSGDLLGWAGGLVDINFSTQISDAERDEEPCIVIDFHDFEPTEDYMNLHK